jgi:superfamily II DNA or RNA helicase
MLLRPFDRVVPLASRIQPRVVTPRAWSRDVFSTLTRTRPFGSVGAAASAVIELLPFQFEPALAVLRHGCTRVLIADEVGLGKTIQAGLLLAELSAGNRAFRSLVLAPAALITQWASELRERFRLEVNKVDAGWLSAQSRSLPSDVNPWSLPGSYIASIDLLKRPEVLRPLEDVTWDIVVVDEAHNAAIGTARLAAAHAIATRARRVLLMTATPPDAEPAQLAALTGIGDLGDPIVQFRRSRADVGLHSRRRTVMLHVRLTAIERRMHRLLDRYTASLWSHSATSGDSRTPLTATVLRKRALSSAASLAASLQRRIALLGGAEPTKDPQLLLPLGEEDALADEVQDSALSAPGLADVLGERILLAKLESLALAASRVESKIRVLVRLIRRVRQSAIVFTEYRDTLARLEAALRSAGHAPVLLHGGMSARDRADVVRLFNDGQSLLLATDAAAEGLNLHHHCRLVIHFELPWMPGRLEQRTGRVDRLGQSGAVHEVLLVARNTAERLVLVPLLKRIRAGAQSGARQSSPLLALTESMVAAGVVGGDEIRLPDEGAAPAAFCRLIDEASGEAERVELQRRGDALGPIVTDGAPLITAGRCGASVRLLVELTLRTTSGQSRHSEVVFIEARVPWDGDRRAGVVREFLRSFLQKHWAAVLEAVDRRSAMSVQTAREQQATVIERLRYRERAMLRKLPSAARRLVQAGLFDNRTVKAMQNERRAAALMIEDADVRSDRYAESLESGCAARIVAVTLGRHR